MTEASPVTHVGNVTPPELNRPSSIGQPLALTDCRVLDEYGNEVAENQPGELVMRGPQFMVGYWEGAGSDRFRPARWMVLVRRYRQS